MSEALLLLTGSPNLSWPVPHGSRYRYAKPRYRWLFSLVDAIGAPMAWARQRHKLLAYEPSSILIVQIDHVGDAVLTTPLIRTLRDRFPQSPIDVLASCTNREIFESNPFVRNVHVSLRNWLERAPGRRAFFSEVFQQARKLRKFRYGLGIDPRGDFLVTLLLWLAGVPRRLGWACGGGGFLLTDIANWEANRHELDARQALLAPLGIRRASTVQRLFPSWENQYHARELLASLPDPEGPLAVLHIAAGTLAKRWPVDHWDKFIGLLRHDWSGSILLVGEFRDRVIARQLARSHAGVFDRTGQESLMELAALLGEADLFVGADSGPAHIAAAMGTPSVVLFSGTNRSECWRPFGPHVQVLSHPVSCAPCHRQRCPLANHPCMAGIRPAAVLDAARQVMRVGPRHVSRHSSEWCSEADVPKIA